MLEKERFLAIKKLAQDIREDNKKIFKSLKKLPIDEAVKKKNDFIKAVIENMNIAFSDGEQGREEKQMFRANILIPDDDEFLETYSKDKNIRNLMNKYAVGIEDVMSKITELNIYGRYLDEAKKEPKHEAKENTDFVDEMVKISPKEAESLLDEIDNLSSVMEDLDLNTIPKPSKPELLKPETSSAKKVTTKAPAPKETKEPEKQTDTDLDDMTSAVSSFVDRYEHMQSEIDTKEDKIRKLQLEIEKLDQLNHEVTNEKDNAVAEVSKLKQEIQKYQTDNQKLQEINNKLETKLAKTAEIMNKIYQSISKK